VVSYQFLIQEQMLISIREQTTENFLEETMVKSITTPRKLPRDPDGLTFRVHKWSAHQRIRPQVSLARTTTANNGTWSSGELQEGE